MTTTISPPTVPTRATPMTSRYAARRPWWQVGAVAGIAAATTAVALAAKAVDVPMMVASNAATLISFAGPITTSNATTATRLVLALTHVLAAAIVIPALARRLAR